jgi:tetratricopeptide (TPR) repeat protein
MSHALDLQDASAEALMGEIVDEFLERLGRGERPEVEEYARQHPPFATILRQMLPTLQLMHLSASEPARAAEWPATDIEPESPLGDFRIVREVGRGGMGVVYEAVQISLGRRVALKVLPFAAALDTTHLQRFKNEAQAAAHLHHSNIVPVYAVGCERGVHYYAMQYIDGQTLAEIIGELRRLAGLEPEDQGGSQRLVSSADAHFICSSLPAPALPHVSAADRDTAVPAADTVRQPAAALSTAHATGDPGFFRTVANLAVQAAEALEHAHSLGVVHRDIKPANLLMDGQGNLWVTDFGLAQVQTDKRLTLTGDLVGTLRYMSPEQALAHPSGVGHRTDLYSLGATFYEFLTLEPTFPGRDRQELLRQIAFEEPRPPRRINKAVPVELETIVLKAMAKNPAERYATARELADDLGRFLKDEPIRARRPTPVQRARRWARRHQAVVWSVAVGLFVALVMLAGSAGWIVRDQAARQAKNAGDIQTALDEAQRSRTEGKWPRAQAAARRAEALLQDGTTDPALAEKVHGLLGELAEEENDVRLVTELEKLRLLQAEVKNEGFFLERALPDYRQAFDDYGLRPDTMMPEEAAARLRRRPPAVLGTLMAAMDHWLILARYKKAPEADWLARVLALADTDAWRQAMRAARTRNDGKALERLAREVDVTAQPPETLFLLDTSLRQRGALEASVMLLRRAQEAFPGDFWINHDLGMALRTCRPPRYEEALRFLTAAVALRPDSPGVRVNLGNAFLDLDRLDEAIEAYREAIRLKSDYAMAHSNLAGALARKGQLGEAIAAFRRAIRLRPDFPLAYNGLGVSLWGTGRLDEAAAALRQAVKLKPNFANAYFNLGNVLIEQGQFEEAVGVCRRAIDLKPDYVEAHYNLGVALERLGRLDEALAAYRHALKLKPDYVLALRAVGSALEEKGRLDEALEVFRQVVEREPDSAEVYGKVGFVLWRMGRLGEAAAAFRQAIALKPDLAMAHHNLGIVLSKLGWFDEAITAFAEAIAHQPDLVMAHYNLGLALSKKGRFDEAATAFRWAIALKPDYAEAHRDLGVLLWREHRFDEAAAAFRQALALEPDHAETYYNLGNALLCQSRHEEAVVAFRRAIELKPDHAEAHCNLGHCLREQGEFAQALVALKRGHELGSRHGDWPYPSARWVRECQRLTELDARLPAILQGEEQPANAAECNEYARLCYLKNLCVASARLRDRAFAEDLELADALAAGHRYDAACAAALAAAGQGGDAGQLDDNGRTRWRKQALEWLRADLTLCRKFLQSGKAENRQLARQRLRHWQCDQYLTGLRDPAAVAKLPADERQACGQLWAEVQTLLDTTDSTK